MSWNTIMLAVVQTIYAWNMYLWPNMIISDPNMQTIQTGIGTLRLGGGGGLRPADAGHSDVSPPPVIVFILCRSSS